MTAGAQAERLRIVAFLRQAAREAYAGMTAVELDGLADRIASGEHWEEPEVAQEEENAAPAGEPAPQSAQIIDLMEALKASLAAAGPRRPK